MTRSMYSKERNPPETEMINRNAIMKDGSLPVVMILDWIQISGSTCVSIRFIN